MRSLLACLWDPTAFARGGALRILAPFRLRRRGVETKLVLGNPTKSVDRTLLRNIANALSWLNRIKAGKTYEEIATEDAIPTTRVRKAIRYAFLAPDIVRAIVDGRQPVGLRTSQRLTCINWTTMQLRKASLSYGRSMKVSVELTKSPRGPCSAKQYRSACRTGCVPVLVEIRMA